MSNMIARIAAATAAAGIITLGASFTDTIADAIFDNQVTTVQAASDPWDSPAPASDPWDNTTASDPWDAPAPASDPWDAPAPTSDPWDAPAPTSDPWD
jgi:hypothetical protein